MKTIFLFRRTCNVFGGKCSLFRIYWTFTRFLLPFSFICIKSSCTRSCHVFNFIKYRFKIYIPGILKSFPERNIEFIVVQGKFCSSNLWMWSIPKVLWSRLQYIKFLETLTEKKLKNKSLNTWPLIFLHQRNHELKFWFFLN